MKRTKDQRGGVRPLLCLAALGLCALLAGAGTLIEGSVTVAPGATTASADITLNLSASRDAWQIDRLTVANASGGGTGSVSFAAYDGGVSLALASTNSLIPSATAVLWPRRIWSDGANTNVELYAARTLRVSVTQSGTNSLATVYNVGALVR